MTGPRYSLCLESLNIFQIPSKEVTQQARRNKKKQVQSALLIILFRNVAWSAIVVNLLIKKPLSDLWSMSFMTPPVSSSDINCIKQMGNNMELSLQ